MVLFGGGKNLQSFVHGEDVARLIVLASEKQDVASGNAYNATSFTVTFKEFIDAVGQELKVDLKYRNIPYLPAMLLGKMLAGLYRAFHRRKAPVLTDFRVKLFGTDYIISSEKAVSELGYEPKWSLLDTAHDIVDWGGYYKPR
jgi:nucleoside-diphosphate-sugar epimerase